MFSTGPGHPPLGPARWSKIQEVNKEAGGWEGGREGGAGAAGQERPLGKPRPGVVVLREPIDLGGSVSSTEAFLGSPFERFRSLGRGLPGPHS